jgi:benzoyl-CoA 2,3-epoxidase subunit B
VSAALIFTTAHYDEWGIMPGKVAKIGTFSDWVGLFDDWRKEIGVNHDDIANFKFDTLYGAIETDEIQFGHFKGRRKWENLRQMPTQAMRDALMNMIVYQGDTEFASCEQQRHLFHMAPTDYDRRALTRVMIEEMRHGWQMCALLVEHFGYSGKVEAQKMLERRAFENKRLLGAFNVDVDNWMDFFTYTDFVDRDGKFQLQMLKYSAFAPLGRSMSYMLREEAFHMGTGNDGLRRIVQAGVIPAWLIQKYLNKWISSSYDLFGTDHSSSAHWAYVWGIKGRYDEPKNETAASLDDLNDYNRLLYRDEVAGLVARLNSALREGEPQLYAPDIKFNRAIGKWSGLKFHAKTGEPLEDAAYEQHLKDFMPTAEDKILLLDTINNEKKWIAVKEGARDPLSSIGEVRKSAINL